MYTIYRFLEKILPFSWIHYEFMKNALLATLLISPVLGLLGTMVVTNRLSFFSDALGHSMLTGIAIGVLCNLKNPIISMVIFAIIFSAAFTKVSNIAPHSQDTIISVLSSIGVSIGITLFSKNGGFAKYSSYLTGDLLSISQQEIISFFVMFIVVSIIWFLTINKLMLVSFNENLALSKGINVRFYKSFFSIVVALTITLCIKCIGVLLVNSMLILPAAAARNISENMKNFYILSILFSMISGVGGLIISYYFGAPSGSIIILIAGIIFFVTLALRKTLNFSNR